MNKIVLLKRCNVNIKGGTFTVTVRVDSLIVLTETLRCLLRMQIPEISCSPTVLKALRVGPNNYI